MKLFKKFGVFLISILIIGVSFVFIASTDDENDFEISKNLDIFYTLFRELNIYYVDETDPGELIKKGIDEMLKSLDPYTNFFPESKIEDYKLMTTGQYGGIGAMIRKSGDYVVVSEPYEGYPAHKADLRAGDVIVEVSGKSTKGISSSEISELLKGQPNTPLSLVIQRPGTPEKISKELTREEIKLKTVPYCEMMTNEIGYLRLSSFTDKASTEVKEAIVELQKNEKLKSIIIDLRGNPGGFLIESVNIVNFFVDKGEEIVSTKGKVQEWNKTYRGIHDPIVPDLPIVLLVNRGSASASEIVSGALQDLDRGVVIGERTFGKGLVQTSRDLSYNSKLKVTTAKYYIPSGRCIQALDYTHKNTDGSVGKVPDSLMTEFSTKNGRKVFDGGGVLPDVDVEIDELSRIAYSLSSKNIIFDFATEYYNRHDSIVAAKDFCISDEEYQTFIAYLSDKEYDYKSGTEEQFKKLESVAKKEKYYVDASESFEKLKAELSHDKEKDLLKFKEEIVQLLNEEITSRYYFQEGRLEAMLYKDPHITKAIEILSDSVLYRSILDGTWVKPKPKTEE